MDAIDVWARKLCNDDAAFNDGMKPHPGYHPDWDNSDLVRKNYWRDRAKRTLPTPLSSMALAIEIAATAEALQRLRALVMTLVPDDSATAAEHKIGLRFGHRQACAQVYDLISATLGDC
jgi:hypothetical protein